VARYRKSLVSGDAEDVHGAAVGSSRDWWCSRRGPGLSYNQLDGGVCKIRSINVIRRPV